MKLKVLVASVALGILSLSNSAFANENGGGYIKHQRAIDEARAPIKSYADLRNYLAAEPSSSPLNRLSPVAKTRFLESLVFTERGLGGYSYEPLKGELTASQIYDVLSLFGAQATTRLIKGATVKNETDRLIMQSDCEINLRCQG